MKRRVVCCFLLVLTVSAALLSGCKTPPLDAAFTEDQVLAASTEIIDLIHSRDYAGAETHFSETLQKGVPEEKLAEVFDPVLDSLGGYQDISKSAIYGAVDSATNNPYAVAVILCRYEKGKAQFTLSFDTQYELIGIYIK